jgi:hypothetical protein
MLVRFLELKKAKKFIPPLAWFERLCHIAMVQFMRRSLAPEVERALHSRLKEKERLLKAISKLQSNVQESLRKLVYWTLPFLGAAVINPHAPNREWADSEATIATLREMGLVGERAMVLRVTHGSKIARLEKLLESSYLAWRKPVSRE